MGHDRWPKRKLTSSPEGRKRRERPEIKCDKEKESAMKQKNTSTEQQTDK
jgi:hypothetical protein